MRSYKDLRPYQHTAIEHIMSNARSALFVFMGGGKTVSTLAAVENLSLVEAVYPILVVAPLRVARSVWPNEVKKWDFLRHLKVSPIVGSAIERQKALSTEADIYTINYENIPWLVETLEDKGIPWPWAIVVADESTKLKSLRISERTSKNGKKFLHGQGGSIRARAIARVAHTHVRRWINLTGTPAPNGLIDLWGQLWPLDGGQRLGRSFEAFKQRWFQAIPGGDGYSQVRPLAHAQAEIQERIKDICLTLDPRDYFDLREPIVNKIYVDLPPKARQLYRQMEKDLFIQIERDEVEAFNAGAKTMKCRQIAQGFAYLGDADEGSGRPHADIHDAKLDALESVIEEAGGAPVIVAYQFKPDLVRLQKRFAKGRVLKTARDEEDFRAGRIPILFMHPASAAHGIDGFQLACNTICYFADDWNLELYEQILERIGPVRQLQAGFERPVYVHIIIARDTVDEDMLVRRETKAEIQEILKGSLKRRAGIGSHI